MMSTYQSAKHKALSLIYTYPKTNNGSYFLTIKNGKKVFFDIFIKKYGLNMSSCKYTDKDVYRRITVIECFEFLLQKYDITYEDSTVVIIQTLFFRFILKKYYFRKGRMRLELLSFYTI